MNFLVDSDALFGLFVARDPHHEDAQQLIRTAHNQATLWVINLVLQETATVLSNKINQTVSLKFLQELPSLNLKIIQVNEALEQKAWMIFKAQTKRGTSFIDCANLATIEHYKFDGILSFDAFYPARLRFAK